MTDGARPPFFVVGSARSGTTLLRLILNAHPEVAVPPESRFVIELHTGRDVVEAEGFLKELASHPRFRTWELPVERVRAELPDGANLPYGKAVAAAYRAYAKAHGKSRWGDKTPRYVEHIPLLARLFPEARFVHLVRDGRNVALSYADVPFGPKTVGKAARLWSRRVEAGLRDGRALGPERYTEVRYERLVTEPEAQVKELCDFLDLNFDPGMLEYSERARNAILSRASAFNVHVTERPNPNVRSWEESMPPGLVEIFEAVAGDILSALGYERRYPHPSLIAKGRAALSLMGLPLGRLKGRTA